MHLGLQSASSVNKIVLKKFSTKKSKFYLSFWIKKENGNIMFYEYISVGKCCSKSSLLFLAWIWSEITVSEKGSECSRLDSKWYVQTIQELQAALTITENMLGFFPPFGWRERHCGGLLILNRSTDPNHMLHICRHWKLHLRRPWSQITVY